MKKLLISLITVLIALMLVTLPVKAEDSSLPVEPAPEAMATDESLPADENSVEGISDENIAEAEPAVPADVEADITVVPAANEEIASPESEQTASEDLVSVEILPGLAEDTTDGYLLADAQGEVISLASEASAALMVNADPYFFYKGIKYQFLLGDPDDENDLCEGFLYCVESLTPINTAIEYIGVQKMVPTDGKIYIESGTYADSVIIDGTDADYGIYWRQIKGISGVTLTTTPILSGSLTVTGTLAGFSLSNLIINNAVLFDGNSGTLMLSNLEVHNPNGDGITISNHIGVVELTNVTASANNGSGAKIDNSKAVFPVKVTNSTFSNNQNAAQDADGISITSKGVVTINGLTARENRARGAAVYTLNAITAAAVDASRNGLDGLYLDNASVSAPITVTNSKFHGNGLVDDSSAGLAVRGKAAITLDGISVVGNLGDGIMVNRGGGADFSALTLNNIYASNNTSSAYAAGSGIRAFTSRSAGVTLYQVYVFGSSLSGIDITTFGAVNGRYIQSSQNGWNGITLNTVGGTGAVNLADVLCNTNNHNGIELYTRGSVILNSIVAKDNLASGLAVDNTPGTGTVSMTSATAAGYPGANVFSGNFAHGIYVLSKGLVSLLNFDSKSNSLNGVLVDNSGGTAGVTISSTLENWINSITGNGLGGLELRSKGAILVNTVEAASNHGHGALLDNSGWLSAAGVTVKNSRFNKNDFSGLTIRTRGLVLVQNTSADLNDSLSANGGYSGMELDNSTGTGTINVNSTTTSLRYSFSGNGGYGILAVSKGFVSISNFIANGNAEMGVKVTNDGSLGAPGVTLMRLTANGNYDTGIYVRSKGPILLDSAEAVGNVGDGADLDNCLFDGSLCRGTGSLTIKAPSGVLNIFSRNVISGLLVSTRGSILLTNVVADRNNAYGALLRNDYPLTSTAVMINYAGNVFNSFSGNGFMNNNDGLKITTFGTITLSRIIASNNYGKGANLDNSYAPFGRAVAVTDSTFNGNNSEGLLIWTDGAVNLVGTSANFNGVFRGILDASGATLTDRIAGDKGGDWWSFIVAADTPVLITMSSSAYDPYLALYDEDDRLVAENDDISPSDNTAKLELVLTEPGMYTLFATSFDFAAYSRLVEGMYVLKLNDPNGLHPTQRLVNGINIQNWGGIGGVTVSDSAYSWAEFSHNTTHGLKILSNGVLNITNASAVSNGADGLNLATVNAVNVINNHRTEVSSFDYNGQSGINISTGGSVNVRGTRMRAYYNGADGVYISNCMLNPMPVNVFGVRLNFNHNYGLQVLSRGNIIVTSIITLENAVGMYLDTSAGFGMVTLNGTLNASGNYGKGVEINATSTVNVSNLLTENNGSYGLLVSMTGIGKAVNLTNVTARYNGADGLAVGSYGRVALTSVFAIGNGKAANLGAYDGAGAWIQSFGNPVSILNSAFLHNEGSGLALTLDGGLFSARGSSWFGNDYDLDGDPDLRYF